MRVSNTKLRRLPFIVLLVLAFELAFAGGTNAELPSACQTGCETPYGRVLGESPRGIKAYSNCQSACVIFEPNQWNGTYTGIKWQCVEYARRWLLMNTGSVFGDVDIAADIWDKIDHLTEVKTKKSIPLEAHLNGSLLAPAVGDLLIYAKAFKGTGHVAVVTGLNLKEGTVEVSEQNFNNQTWADHYARTIKLIENEGRYWLLDAYLLGWRHPIFGPQ